MALYLATLSTQSTHVYVCDIVKPANLDTWFANVMATGTFGGGTVTFDLSFDSGTTLIPMMQDGTATAATMTTASALNLRAGWTGSNLTIAKLYASLGTATTPSIAISVLDNR